MCVGGFSGVLCRFFGVDGGGWGVLSRSRRSRFGSRNRIVSLGSAARVFPVPGPPPRWRWFWSFRQGRGCDTAPSFAAVRCATVAPGSHLAFSSPVFPLSVGPICSCGVLPIPVTAASPGFAVFPWWPVRLPPLRRGPFRRVPLFSFKDKILERASVLGRVP
jgi:hypothetical protein